MSPPSPRSTLFPYTTLFRSALQLGGVELYRQIEANDRARTVPQGLFADILRHAAPCLILLDELADYCVGASAVERSEEHTSELQSLRHLVCRLLLEKKNKTN